MAQPLVRTSIGNVEPLGLITVDIQFLRIPKITENEYLDWKVLPNLIL